jgi:hypothetical protein
MGFISRHRLERKKTFLLKKTDPTFYTPFLFIKYSNRLSMHFGVVDHIPDSTLTTADRRPPSWNRITDSTHAPPVGNGIGEPHYKRTTLGRDCGSNATSGSSTGSDLRLFIRKCNYTCTISADEKHVR